MKLAKMFVALTMGIWTASSVAAADVEYFETLQKEVVISEDYVEWLQFAPGNAGYSEYIFTHPTDAKTIFNFPDMHNSYRSTDGGANWKTVLNSDLSNRGQMSRVVGVDFSRSNENFGMAVSGAGVFTTYDKGATWSRPSALTGAISAIAVDPNNDQIWYAGSGGFWDSKGNHTTLEMPHGKKVVNSGKLYKTIDGGKSWQRLPVDIPSKAIFGEIYVNPNDSNMIFALTSYGLYKATDGKTFKKITTIEEEDGVDRDLVRDMAVHVDGDALTIVAINQVRYEVADGTVASTGGIVKSTDFGETWTSINGNLGVNYKALSESSEETAAFIRGWFPGWFKKYFGTTETYGAAIQTLPTDMLQNYERIVIDPTNPNNIYVEHNAKHSASMFIGDVWATHDGGKTWIITSRIGQGFAIDKEYWDSVGQPTDVNVKLDHVGNHYYGNQYDTQAARDLDIDIDGNVYIMYRNFVKSEDDGATWAQLDSLETPAGNWVGTGASNMPGGYIITDPYLRDPNLMFLISGENGLFKRADDAATVKPGSVAVQSIVGSPESPATIGFSPTDINTMYMTIYRQDHNGEFLKSVDGGMTWDAISRWYTLDTNMHAGMYPKNIIVEEGDETIYFSNSARLTFEVSGPTQNGDMGGVYKSTDGGYSWDRITAGLPHVGSVFGLARKSETEFYAGSTSWRSVPIKAAKMGTNTLNVWEVTGVTDATNRVYPKKIQTNSGDDIKTQDVAALAGNGIGMEQTVPNLTPNTKYYLDAVVRTEGEEVGTLYAKSLDGTVIAEADFASPGVSDAKGVFFETGDDETSVTIGVEKKTGAGEVYVDNFYLRAAGGLYKSTDAAENWVAVDTFPEVAQVNAIEIIHDKIYVTAGDEYSGGDVGGLWVSEDDGLSWEKLFEMPYVMGITVHPHYPEKMMVLVADGQANYGAINTGIYLSDDGGASWDKINKGLGNPSQVYDMSFDPDPTKLDTIWATSSGGGFYKGTISSATKNVAYAGELLLSNEDFPAGATVKLDATISDATNYTITLSSAADIKVLTSNILENDGNTVSFEFIMPNRDVDVLADFKFILK